MPRLVLLGALICVAGTASAQVSSPGVGAPAPSPTEAGAEPPVTEADEIERAIAADQAAQAKKLPRPAPTEAAITPTTGSTTIPPSATAEAPLGSDPATPGPLGGRGFQSLNPDMSVILDLAGGWFSDDSNTTKSGDDPQSTGIKVQEVELALQQVVDPYFRADVFLTIPNLSGLEVEEAFLTTTQLPGNFQLKAGIFRAGLGRQNAQHLHLQDFPRRPTLNAQLLGVDGLRAPGLEVNWLVPDIPFFLVLSASAFSVEAAEPDQPLQTFGGGRRRDLAAVVTARAFFPLSEATSLYAGLNYGRGKTSQSTLAGQTLYDGYVDNLYGADLYLKWKPANQAQTYASFAWQTEYFVRQIPNLAIDGVKRPDLEGALYSQAVMQTHRRIYLGLRGELMGVPRGDNINRQYAGAISVTWALSEFSRIRLYGELRRGARLVPFDGSPREPRTTGAVFLQLEATIGAHGAHPF